jgi:hypothetical protein
MNGIEVGERQQIRRMDQREKTRDGLNVFSLPRRCHREIDPLHHFGLGVLSDGGIFLHDRRPFASRHTFRDCADGVLDDHTTRVTKQERRCVDGNV